MFILRVKGKRVLRIKNTLKKYKKPNRTKYYPDMINDKMLIRIRMVKTTLNIKFIYSSVFPFFIVYPYTFIYCLVYLPVYIDRMNISVA